MTFDNVVYCRDDNLFDCFPSMRAFCRAYLLCSLHQSLCQTHLQIIHLLSLWFGYKGRKTGPPGLVSEILRDEHSVSGSPSVLEQERLRV